MRKLMALFIMIVVFIPLAVSAMTLMAVRPWLLDRGFYKQLLGDERLYDLMLAEEPGEDGAHA